jgi:hypothetical protein
MRFLAIIVLLLALAAAPAQAAVTRVDEHGTIYVDGVKTFPIALLKPPPREGVTPWGTPAIDEVVRAGVNILDSGPLGREWKDTDLADTRAWADAAALRGVHTWVHLRELARAAPDSPQEAKLREVVTALRDHPAVAMWKTVDEPWWSRYPVTALTHSYAVIRSLDPNHLTFLNQAPRGRPSDLAPYTAVGDVHSIDIYPVKFVRDDPNLHWVGLWTERLRSVTPNQAVMTMLQICYSGSDDPNGGDAYVLPTYEETRYMVYDSILNGARGLTFFGGHNVWCLEREDAPHGWHWMYWQESLKPVIQEIGPRSRLYPALLEPGSELRVRVSNPKTQVIARRVGREIWVIAARWGRGEFATTIRGLPRSVTRRGWVYREGRRVAVRNGAFTDTFGRWDVHVYRFVEG